MIKFLQRRNFIKRFESEETGKQMLKIYGDKILPLMKRNVDLETFFEMFEAAYPKLVKRLNEFAGMEDDFDCISFNILKEAALDERTSKEEILPEMVDLYKDLCRVHESMEEFMFGD